MTTEVSKNEFERVMRPRINLHFDWSRFRAQDAFTVEEVALRSNEFSRVFATWYYDYRSNRSANYDDVPRPTPLSIAAALPLRKQLKAVLVPRVEDYLRSFQAGDIPPVAPAYFLKRNRFLLLDGNHRMLAHHLGRIPHPIRLWAVKGPLEQSVVLDLRHWR